MPSRLLGARASFIENPSGRSVVGKIKEIRNESIIVQWENPIDPPLAGKVNIITFAMGFEFCLSASVISGDKFKGKLEITSEIREHVMSKALRLTSEPVKAIAKIQDQTFEINIVAYAVDAFAFESKETLPMDESLVFYLVNANSEIPLNSELILQRFEAGSYRGLATIRSFSRLAEMHWLRLSKNA